MKKKNIIFFQWYSIRSIGFDHTVRLSNKYDATTWAVSTSIGTNTIISHTKHGLQFRNTLQSFNRSIDRPNEPTRSNQPTVPTAIYSKW